MKLSASLFFLVIFIGYSNLLSGQDNCSDILKDGVFDQYNVSTSRDFKSSIHKVLDHNYSSLSSKVRNRDFGLNFPIPIAEGLINMGLNDSDSRTNYNNIQSNFRKYGSSSMSNSEYNWLYSKMANESILEKWESCMQSKFSTAISGNVMRINDNKFLLILQYVPNNSFSPESVEISDVTVINAEFSNGTKIASGRELEAYTGLTQAFTKDENETSNITVNLKGYKPLSFEIKRVDKIVKIRVDGTWKVKDIYIEPFDISPRFKKQDYVGQTWNFSSEGKISKFLPNSGSLFHTTSYSLNENKLRESFTAGLNNVTILNWTIERNEDVLILRDGKYFVRLVKP